MTDDWLEVDETLLLAHISDGSDTFPCVWTGEPVGESAVVLVPQDTDGKYALLAVRNVDLLQEALERVQSGVQLGTALSPSGYVRYEENTSEKHCLLCGEAISEGAPQVGIDILMSRPQYVPSSAAALHEGCVTDFNDKLDKIWDETDILLGRAFED